MKQATLQTCSPENLAELSAWATENKLALLPLSMQGRAQGYANSTQAVISGKPWEYRILIAKPGIAFSFAEYWKNSDDSLIGEALGFPECCREFFKWSWVEQGWRDTTLPMAMGRAELYAPIYRVGGPLECNILLRWVGVRLVSHLPCSFYCEHTKEIGKQMQMLALESGYKEEVGWIQEMLQWPVQWSSLHGVATITTPAFRIVTSTTALKSKIVVERDGPNYPEEGARGNQFPFKNHHRLVIHQSNEYSDNGFKTRAAMNEAHDLIVNTIQRALYLTDKRAKVIDLGCGNGALLEKILGKASWLVPCGVEKEASKHQRAARRLVGYDPDLHLGDLYDDHYWDPPYSTAILSVNRLNEVDEHDARTLMSRLRDGCRYLVLYSYDDSSFQPEGYVLEYFKLIPACSSSNQSGAAHLLESRGYK